MLIDLHCHTKYSGDNQLEPIELDSASYRPRQALGYLPLLLALAISLGLAMHRLLGTLPRRRVRGEVA